MIRNVQVDQARQESAAAARLPSLLLEEVVGSLRNFQRLSYFATTDREMFYRSASLKQWLDAGVVLGMGTASGSPLSFHTEALWREIKAPRRRGHAALAGHLRG